MDENWMEQFQKQNLSTQLLLTNQYTQQYGLVLTQEDTELILEGRKNALQEQRRVEFGESILPRIIFEFCDSAYIRQDNYTQTLLRLQEIFFLYKNEMEDEITDDELLHFMKEQFETICYGDLEYLEGTCLTGFAEAIRAGYRGYKESEGYGEYAQFDAVPRWDYNLYMEALKELFWE